MKKVLLTALALLMGTFMYAQQNRVKIPGATPSKDVKTEAVLSAVKAPANTNSARTTKGDSELTYCTADIASSVGVGGGTYIEWAAAFRPSMYTADDNFVTSVDFYSYAAATYTLKIYDGEPAAAVPANLLYTHDYEVAEASAWVNLPIYSAVVEIDHTKALWVAVGATDPDYPATYSNEVLTSTDCCMMYFQGEWNPINQLGSFQIQPWMIVANTTSDEPAVTCEVISTFPYFNDFENFLNEKDCWISIDNDGDGQDWITGTTQSGASNGYNSSTGLVSKSYDYNGSSVSYDADNYLVSPEFELPAGYLVTLSWYAMSTYAPSYPDHYEVMIAPNGSTDISDFVSVFSEDGPADWTQRTVDISAYAGTTVRVVFHHQDYDQYWIVIDNLGIEAAFDCSSYGFPFAESFENGLDCWGNYDEDGDGHTWQLAAGQTGNGAQSVSWSSATSSLNPDNWLVSPEITIPATAGQEGTVQLSWYVKGGSSSYPDHYGVYVSTTGNQPADFTTQLYDGTSPASWTQLTADLSAYIGQTVRVAFRHYNSYDKWSFTIDDIEIYEYVEPTPPAPVTCDPITTFPYFNDFENFGDEKHCWIDIDNDGDGYGWFTDTEAYWGNEFGVDGSNCLVSQSYENYVGARNADNYLLSPEVVFPANSTVTLSWYEQSQDESYPDYYEVMIAPNGSTEISDFVSIYSGEAAYPWTERTADISAYAGTTVRVVFHHQSYDCYFLEIDNMGITVEGGDPEPGNYPYLETFDVNGMDDWSNLDEDGDGHLWELAAGYTGQGAKSVSWESSSKGSDAARRDNAAQKENGRAAYDPDNWLISPEITIPSTAGQEGPVQLSWYVKGASSSFPDHYGVYVSTTGNQPADFTTQLYEGTSPVSWTQLTVDLNAYIGQTVRVAFRHYASSDKMDFVIDDIAIQEYVEPAPVVCDPITTFPYFNDFEDFLTNHDCWIDIDNDGDGQTWLTGTTNYGTMGWGVDDSNCLVSQSYDNNLGSSFNADNYLVSPEFELPAGNTVTLSWYEQSQDESYPDYYEVMIAPNGSTEISDFVPIYSGIAENPWTERTADLTEYAGTTVRVVFHHQSYDCYFLEIDNMGITVEGGGDECAITTFPYLNEFEDFASEVECWVSIDNDGDGEDWLTGTAQSGAFNGYNYSSGLVSKSYNYDEEAGVGTDLDADNYLVSPEFVLPANGTVTLSWYVMSTGGDNWPDYYEVMIAPNGSTDTSDFVSVFSEDGPADWAQRTADISAYAGTTVRVVFHHQDYAQYWIVIDNLGITVEGGTVGPEPVVYINPTDGMTDVESPVAASWTLGNNTTEMQLLFGSQFPPQDVLIDWTSELVESTTLSNLLPNTTYFMQVNERNDNGITMGDVIGFTTTFSKPVAEVATQHLYPGDAAMLSWEMNRSFRGYNVYADGVKVNEALIVEDEYAVEGLEYGMHTLNVTAVYDAGESAYSNNILVNMTGYGHVAGTVFEQNGTTPVEGAAVKFIGTDAFGFDQTFTFITAANGTFAGDIYEGSYASQAELEGYQVTPGSDVTIAYDQTVSGLVYNMFEEYKPVGQVNSEITADNKANVWWSWAPATVIEDFEGGEMPEGWNQVGSYGWEITTNAPYEGTYCIKSSNAGIASSTGAVEVTVDVPYEAKMSFYVKPSSESSYDKFFFYIDGVEKFNTSGAGSWTKKEYSVTAGTHTYKWAYTKDGSVNSNDDCIYVDYVTLFEKTEPTPPVIGGTTYEFENTMEGWTSLDADGDGFGWMLASQLGITSPGHDGSADFVYSQSYDNTYGVLYPDNYLVSPSKLACQAGAQVKLWACGQDANYAAEHFGVAVSTGGATAAEFATIAEWTIGSKGGRAFKSADNKAVVRGTRDQSEWTEYTVDLSAYAGQEVWVAIRHFNVSDQYFLDVDDITLATGGAKMETADNRSFQSYNVYRKNVLADEYSKITSTADTTYVDAQWSTLPASVYQYGVSATYAGNRGDGESEIVWAEPMDNDMVATVEVSAVTNNGQSAAGTLVRFVNNIEEVSYEATLDETGFVSFADFRKGYYTMSVELPGYTASMGGEVEIFEDKTYNVTLTEAIAPAEGLFASATGWVMWDNIGGDIPTPGEGDEFTEGFESGSIPTGWTTIDADGDGNNWMLASELGLGEPGHNNSADFMLSQSYINYFGALTPDNYLVTPKVKITTGSEFSFWACAQDPSYPSEHYGVAISTTTATAGAFTTIAEWTMTAKETVGAGTYTSRDGKGTSGGTWYQKTVDLSEYAGQEVYIAIRHFNCTDCFYLDVDDAELAINSKGNRAAQYSIVKLDGVIAGQATGNWFQLDTDNLVEGQEYEVSVASVYASGMSEWKTTTFTYYSCDNFKPGVKNLAGEVQGVNDVKLTWTLPGGGGSGDEFSFSFDNDLEGWTNIDADGDGHMWYHSNEAANHSTLAVTSHSGAGHVMGESYCNATWAALTPNDFFVTPQQYNIGASSMLSFWACAQDENYAAEHFGVAISTNGNTSASDFTTIAEWTLTAKTGFKGPRATDGSREGSWYQYTCDLSEYAGQAAWIAIRHFNCSDQFIMCLDDISMSNADGKANRDDEYLQYCTETYDGAVGTGGGQVWWANAYTPAQLADYDGRSITKVGQWVSAPDMYGNIYDGTYNVEVYVGGSTSAPGTLVASASQYITGDDAWHDLELNTPVTIDATQHLWFVFNANNIGYPMCGSAYVGDPNSDILSLDGMVWEHAASGYGFNYTWMIRGLLSGDAPIEGDFLGAMIFRDGELITPEPLMANQMVDANVAEGEHEYMARLAFGNAELGVLDTMWYAMSCPVFATVNVEVECTPVSELDATEVDNADGTYGVNLEWICTGADIQGYKVYRNNSYIGTTTTMSYYDDRTNNPGNYTYGVVAVYDYCESDMVTTTVSVDAVGENEVIEGIYPNPTKGILNINATAMQQITVVNALGQIVINVEVSGDQKTIDMSGFEAGVYMVTVRTENGSSVKRISVIK